MRRKRIWLAALLLLALVFSVPLLSNLEVFRRPVHQALERRLGRPVEFASLTARLLPRPGLVGEGLMVYEQDGFGDEPFLYAGEVRCDLPLRALWNWRLEFSEIHFVRPTINLVRNSQHAWNVGSWLLTPTLPGGAEGSDPTDRPASDLRPVISASEGRLNFKLGFDKQVYALTDVRLRLDPQPQGRWRAALEATPLRVDRRLTETGVVRLQGELGTAADFSSLPFRLDAALEGGSLAQWWTLFTGREPPLRAQASLSAQLDGTPAAWIAQGTLTLANLHRWDLVAPARSPRWQTEFTLQMLSHEGTLELRKAVVRTEQSELQLTGRIYNPFRQPRWDLEVSAGRLALDELRAQWAGLKANLSPELRWDGTAQLALTAAGPLETWKGILAAPSGTALRVPGLPRPLELGDLRVRLDRGRLELLPLTLRFSPAHALTLSGDLGLGSAGLPYRVRWQSPRLEMEPLWRTAEALGWDLFHSQRWQGQTKVDLEWRGQFRSQEPPRWHGYLEVRQARFHSLEFNQPVEVLEARLGWSGTRLELRPLLFRLGENTVTGSLERRRHDTPWQANFSAGRVRLADLDALVNPAQRGLLARLVQPEVRRVPAWEQLAVVGDLRVEELAAGPLRLRAVEAQGEWRAGSLDLHRLRFRTHGGRFDGRLQADFRSSPPQYRLAGNLKELPLAPLLAETTKLGPLVSGQVSAELALQTQGAQPRELRRHLQGRIVGGVHQGTFTHFNLLAAMAAATGAAPGDAGSATRTSLQSLAGDFRLAEEQVELDAVQLIVDGAALELAGRVSFAARLDLRLTGEPLRVAGREPTPFTTRLLAAPYRITGTLAQPEVQLAEPLPAAPDRSR